MPKGNSHMNGNSYANGPQTGKPREVAAAETNFWPFAEGDDPKLFAS